MKTKLKLVYIVTLIAIIASVGYAVYLNQYGNADYKETNLPFNAVNLRYQQGGGYSETVGADGKIQANCAGLSLDSLSLGSHEIALQSTDVTSDGMIQTEDYGNLRIKINMASGSYSILLTPHQEKKFQKLLNGQQ